jgi:hypothetical protein
MSSLNLIQRTLFWFSDGDQQLLSLNERYFALGTLLNRLLNEKYEGEKIRFINIYFRTEETYNLHPQAPKNFTHFEGGELAYDDVFDRLSFNKLATEEQDKVIWQRAHEILKESARATNNKYLSDAATYAFNKGISLNLNPDYKMVEADVELFGELMKASIWVHFKNDGMYAELTLEQDQKIVFARHIDKTKNGVEFFLEMYKRIEVDSHNIIIQGRRDVDYLPLKIPIEKSTLNI